MLAEPLLAEARRPSNLVVINPKDVAQSASPQHFASPFGGLLSSPAIVRRPSIAVSPQSPLASLARVISPPVPGQRQVLANSVSPTASIQLSNAVVSPTASISVQPLAGPANRSIPVRESPPLFRRDEQAPSGREVAGASIEGMFDEAVAAERLRLTAEFEEYYRKKAASIEACARASAAQQAQTLEADEATARGPSVDLEVAALKSEILQETVLADELQAEEEASATESREHSAMRPRLAGRPPKPGERFTDAASESDAASEVQQERAALRQLEQRAWRAQNAVRASEAHEDLLQAHRKDLERRLSEVKAASDEIASATLAENATEEDEQLPALELWEAGLSERVHQGSEAEAAAQQATESLQTTVMDLESECDALWLDITLGGNRGIAEAAQIRGFLEAALQLQEPASQMSVDQLFDELEAQSQAVQDILQMDLRNGSSALLPRETERLNSLESDVANMNEEVRLCSEQAVELKAEIKLGARAVRDAEDRLAEAASLRKESDVLRRQQQLWQKSQLRMLRLIEDMQRQRLRDVQSQATVATRLAELQRELPLQELSIGTSRERASNRSYPSSRSPSPPKGFGSPGDPNLPPRGPSRLNALWSDNVALKSQLRRLEEEKDELIRGQEGLINLVKSKMPTIEQARESMRLPSDQGLVANRSLSAARDNFLSQRPGL